MKKNPKILSSEKDGLIVRIEFIDGKEYKLQHPGNRKYMEMQQEMFDFENGINQIAFLDEAFAHCVIPEGHSFKPTIDDIHPAELEVWQRTLRRFLRGELAIGTVGQPTEPEKESSETTTRVKR